MSKPNKLKPLRPSASLILPLGNQALSSHRYLTIVRNPHMSFANSLVFPGGVCQAVDDKYTQSNSFQVFAKITAIRETAEETGVLLLPPQTEFNRLMEFKDLYKKKQQDKIADFISNVWSKNLDLIRPVFRVATPQLINTSRFDCIFYVVDKLVQKINLGASSDLETLDIGVSQSAKYFWKQPHEYLSQFVQGNLKLPPPQILLFNILARLQSRGWTSQHLFNDEMLLVQPMMFQLSSKMDIIIHLDHQYDIKRMLEKQPQSKNAQLIKQYLSQYPFPLNHQIQRRIKRQESDKGIKAIFKYSGLLPQRTIFKYLLQQKSSL